MLELIFPVVRHVQISLFSLVDLYEEQSSFVVD